MRWLELKIPPPAVAILVGAAMWLAAGIGPALRLPPCARIAVFAAFALFGGAIALAGELQFKRAATTVNPFKPQSASTLVTSGIYRRTRNPMYVGLVIVVLGWAAFLCSVVAFLGPPAFVLYIRSFQIIPEERILSANFGEAYATYRSRVRRWL
jgi:protein-S-isoprenylcysteine O-methyltransferase Ste14